MARRAILVLLCLVLVAAGAAAPRVVADPQEPAEDPGGEPAPAWSYDPDAPIPDDEIEARMDDEDIDHDEAVRRFRIEDATTLVEPEASARWPQSFGGVWIEIDPFAVKVAFTEAAETRVDKLREGFPFPETLEAVNTPVSKRVLETKQEMMIADRAALQAGLLLPHLPRAIRDTEGRYDLDIELPAGQLVVGVEKASGELRQAFQAAYLDRLRLEEGLSIPVVCNTDDCRYAVMSGLRLNLYDNDGNHGGDCSSAFMTYARADFNVRYVLSAAHCSRIGGTGPETLLQRRHVHEHIGPANNRKLGGTTDAERIKLVQSPWLNSSKTVVDGTLPRMIDTYKTYAQINIGDYVGKTGARTGTTRGYVGSKSEAPSFIPNSSNFIRASFCVARGDSGAGVWEQRNALGIVSARWDVKPCRHAETFDFSVGQGIFGAVEFAMDALNVGLLTNRNIRARARFTASCLAFECTFSGAPSYDWDGAIVNYAWDFGDGTTGSGQNASKTYTTAGTKTVTLTVTDNDGEPSNPKSETVTIPSLPILE